ncbi:MAG: NADH-quinone oxidoreductase subunit C, partial [Clostridia bacterium]|nr:NADH-quinone oxidoreductase subunit C [Clostridia bacterium]
MEDNKAKAPAAKKPLTDAEKQARIAAALAAKAEREAAAKAAEASKPVPEIELAIANKIIAKFPFLKERIRIPREHRLYTDAIEREQFRPLYEYVADELGFDFVSTISGVDVGDDFQVIYHLSNNKNGSMFNVKVRMPKDDAVIESIVDKFEGVTFYERELVDLFGIQVNNMPPGLPHYPLPDGWPADQHPLRKDWDPSKMDWSVVKAEAVQQDD